MHLLQFDLLFSFDLTIPPSRYVCLDSALLLLFSFFLFNFSIVSFLLGTLSSKKTSHFCEIRLPFMYHKFA